MGLRELERITELENKLATLEIKVKKFKSTNISVMPCPAFICAEKCVVINTIYCGVKPCDLSRARAQH